jgi:hypothetical protein
MLMYVVCAIGDTVHGECRCTASGLSPLSLWLARTRLYVKCGLPGSWSAGENLALDCVNPVSTYLAILLCQPEFGCSL